MRTTEEIVIETRSWAICRIKDKTVSYEDARAIVGEFYEWLEPSEDPIEIISL